MIEWLTNSPPGIILLGAIGSMLAVGMLKLAGTLMHRYLRPAMTSNARRVFVFWRSPKYVLEYLSTESTDPRDLIVTCTLLLSGLFYGVLLVVAGITVGASALSLVELKSGLGKWLLFWSSLAGFTGLLFIAWLSLFLRELYLIHMKKAEAYAAARAGEEFDTGSD